MAILRVRSLAFTANAVAATIFLGSLWGSLGMTDSKAAESTASSTAHPPWFSGSVEAAFQAAKQGQKPVLLYWGAVWCPPCNELKSQVFSRPRFQELVKPLVPVYLDGDSPEAQAWADKLKVSGYPTVLLLSPEGKERMRLATSLSFAEFESALTNALASARSFDEALAKASTGKARDDDWRLLAYYAWDSLDTSSDHGKVLQQLFQATEQVPIRLTKERALLAAKSLETAAAKADSDEPSVKSQVAKEQAMAPQLLKRMFANAESIQAVRATIAYAPGDVLTWAFPSQSQEQADAEATWLQAAKKVAVDPEASIDVRLWASAAPLTVLKARNKEAPVPEELKRTVQSAAYKADADAKTAFERHSVISGAAYLLRQAGDLDAARHLLDKELAVTDTPWYYQSSYAALEKAAKRDHEALLWAKKARESTKGRASRLQWIVEDLTLNAKVASAPGAAPQHVRMKDVTQAYYQEALTLPDAFLGRNAARAKKVVDALKPFLNDKEVRSVIETARAKCGKQVGCTAHFAALGAGVQN